MVRASNGTFIRAFRIADSRFPIFDGTGARLNGGRWNSPGSDLIYAAETYSGAMLEVLVHANLGVVPKNHACVEIDIPHSVSLERIPANHFVSRMTGGITASRDFGDLWLRERRSTVLLVPSFIAHGREHNILLNPQHADFSLITASKPAPLAWDPRLFRR